MSPQTGVWSKRSESGPNMAANWLEYLAKYFIFLYDPNTFTFQSYVVK